MAGCWNVLPAPLMVTEPAGRAVAVAADAGAEVGTELSFPVSGTTGAAVGVAAVPQALSSIAATIRTNMETDNFLFIFFSPFSFHNLENTIG
jgi:hypothetical protein